MRRTYAPVLAACVAFQLLHLFLLPLVMSPDGLEYVALSRLFGQPDVLDQWVFFRMPLYPLILRATFEVFGENAVAAIVPGTALGFAGAWVVASELRHSAGSGTAAAVLAVLCLYPVLVAYQHAVLTEAGTFCVLAVVVALLLRLIRKGPSLVTIGLLACVLTAGYLYRATLLGVVPAAAAVVSLVLWRSRPAGSEPERSRTVMVMLAVSAAVVLVGLPLVASRVWSAQGRAARIQRALGHNLVLNLAQQGILRIDDPLLASARPAYETALATGEFLSLRPVPDAVAAALLIHAQNGDAVFSRTVVSNPGAYAAAALRVAAAFAGIAPSGENHLFTSNVLSLSVPDAKCVCPVDRRAEFQPFSKTGRRSPIHYMLKILYPLFRPFVVVGWLLTVVALVVGLRRLDLRLVAVSLVPLSFAAGHVLLLFGIDRYAVSTFPLALANLFAVSRWVLDGPRRKPARA